jgi:aminoglycoside phosphotransferase (APT) family kinase protein
VALEAVAAHLGSSLIEASLVPWGESRSSYRVVLAGGRVVAARHLRGPGSLRRAQALVERSDLLAARGVAVAHPAQLGPGDDASAWVLTPWVEGAVGAVALQRPESSRELAARMGRLAAVLTSIDVDGLVSNRPWAGLEELREASAGWLAALRDAMGPNTFRVADRALGLVTSTWDGGAPWHVGLSHGDFGPINVIVRSDGSLVVLDLDDVQPGPRILDVAWWGWVVGYHHPVAWAWSWPTFVAAAGLEPGPGLDAAATAVPRVRLLERAAQAPDQRLRAQWLRRLDESTSS